MDPWPVGPEGDVANARTVIETLNRDRVSDWQASYHPNERASLYEVDTITLWRTDSPAYVVLERINHGREFKISAFTAPGSGGMKIAYGSSSQTPGTAFLYVPGIDQAFDRMKPIADRHDRQRQREANRRSLGPSVARTIESALRNLTGGRGLL